MIVDLLARITYDIPPTVSPRGVRNIRELVRSHIATMGQVSDVKVEEFGRDVEMGRLGLDEDDLTAMLALIDAWDGLSRVMEKMPGVQPVDFWTRRGIRDLRRKIAGLL